MINFEWFNRRNEQVLTMLCRSSRLRGEPLARIILFEDNICFTGSSILEGENVQSHQCQWSVNGSINGESNVRKVTTKCTETLYSDATHTNDELLSRKNLERIMRLAAAIMTTGDISHPRLLSQPNQLRKAKVFHFFTHRILICTFQFFEVNHDKIKLWLKISI